MRRISESLMSRQPSLLIDAICGRTELGTSNNFTRLHLDLLKVLLTYESSENRI